MCGMDNEIAVFSQWRDDSYQDSGPSSAAETGTLAGPDDRGDIVEHRNLQEADILNLAQVKTSSNKMCEVKNEEGYDDIFFQESQMRNVRSHGSFTNLTNASLKHLSDGEKRKKGKDYYDTFLTD